MFCRGISDAEKKSFITLKPARPVTHRRRRRRSDEKVSVKKTEPEKTFLVNIGGRTSICGLCCKCLAIVMTVTSTIKLRSKQRLALARIINYDRNLCSKCIVQALVLLMTLFPRTSERKIYQDENFNKIAVKFMKALCHLNFYFLLNY